MRGNDDAKAGTKAGRRRVGQGDAAEHQSGRTGRFLMNHSAVTAGHRMHISACLCACILHAKACYCLHLDSTQL